MLCSDILSAALQLLGEDGGAEGNEDYAERAPYIIASFVSEASEADAMYRLAHGKEAAELSDRVYIDLTETFPLSGRFTSLAAFYLASMLIADESPELSDKFYDKYCDGVSAIISSLPSTAHGIAQQYN